MQHTKDLPLGERNAPFYREHHLALALLILLGVSVIPSGHRALGGIQAFSALLSLPVLILVCGRLSRGLEKTWQTIVNGIDETNQIQENARKQRIDDQKRLEAIRADFNKRYHG